MPNPASTERVARLVDPRAVETTNVMGPTIEFLTPPGETEDATPCVMRGAVPPGGIVPLHAHANPETYLARSGGTQGGCPGRSPRPER